MVTHTRATRRARAQAATAQTARAAERLNATFSALADPTRRELLARLGAGEATVGELARPFAMSQPAISKHLRVLERAGLVRRGRDAQRRPCRLAPGPLREAATWLETQTRFWEEALDRLEMHLARTQEETHEPRRRGPRR